MLMALREEVWVFVWRFMIILLIGTAKVNHAVRYYFNAFRFVCDIFCLCFEPQYH